MSRPSPVALVTGVSRQVGIGDAVVRRLRSDGVTVFATGWPAHDDEQPWDGGPPSAEHPGRHDLGDAGATGALVDEVYDEHGRLDIVVAAHARSSGGGLADITPEELDRTWAVNVRSVVLLAQRWAEHRGVVRVVPPSGRLIFFTSGQHLGPMEGELVYALSKGALHQLALTLDRAMADCGVVVNCVNPGPVDTGYADAGALAAVADRFPDGRWTSADETADLIAFLVSERGAIFRGRVLDAEAGFRR